MHAKTLSAAAAGVAAVLAAVAILVPVAITSSPADVLQLVACQGAYGCGG
jgi:hypothetical protein